MAFDHSNVDAYSIYRIPAEVGELYAAGVAGRTVPRPRVGSYVDFCEAERAQADRIDGDHDIVARWRGVHPALRRAAASFPVDLGVRPGGPLPEQRMLREPLVDAADAAAFEAYCRPYGGSLVGVLAATALIVHEIGGEPVYRTVVPFHTRSRSQWTEFVGWYVGGAPIEIPVERAHDFPAALRTVRAELQANRRLSRMPIDRVLRLLGTDFRPTSPDLYSIVSYVDARDVPGAAHWPDQSAYALLRVSYGDQVCAWVTRLPEGLWFASRYPDTDVAHKTCGCRRAPAGHRHGRRSEADRLKGAEAHVRVGVLAGDEDVDAVVVEQPAAEGDQGQVGGLAALPARGGAGVQVAGVGDPGDEGPGLLGVPAPVAAPGVARPDGARDHREGPQREDGRVDAVGELVEGGRGGQPVQDRAGEAAGRAAGGELALEAVLEGSRIVETAPT
ncbi:hypothetical protein SVIOM342S_05753 [Streptomyces violaceorubidus]